MRAEALCETLHKTSDAVSRFRGNQRKGRFVKRSGVVGFGGAGLRVCYVLCVFGQVAGWSWGGLFAGMRAGALAGEAGRGDAARGRGPGLLRST